MLMTIADLGSLLVLCQLTSLRTCSLNAVDNVELPMVKSLDGKLTGLEMVQTETSFSIDYANDKID